MTSVDDINSLESEAGIIASLIHKPDFIFYSEYLLPNHFTNKENRCVYTAIGEVIVALHNDSDKCETIHHGDRIAQLVIMPYISVDLHEVDELSDTDRGAGGFGSTGVSL